MLAVPTCWTMKLLKHMERPSCLGNLLGFYSTLAIMIGLEPESAVWIVKLTYDILTVSILSWTSP